MLGEAAGTSTRLEGERVEHRIPADTHTENAATLKNSALVTLTSRTRPEDWRTNRRLPEPDSAISAIFTSPHERTGNRRPVLMAQLYHGQRMALKRERYVQFSGASQSIPPVSQPTRQ